MEQVNLGYSTKNIPVPDQKTYLNMLISSLEQGLHRMQWSALHFMNPTAKQTTKQTFNFATPLPAPNLDQLHDFKQGLIKIAENIEFTKHSNPLQEKLKKDIEEIKSSDKVLIGADKTANFYKIKPEEYDKMLKENITKDYKKANADIVEKLDKQDKAIAEKLDIADRMYKLTKREAHITVKDHKDDFRNNPKCRLINPTKPELGIVSKKILRAKIEIIKAKSGLVSLKDSNDLKYWFSNIHQKHAHTFIQWDFEKYYPSITKPLLMKAIEHARKYVDFTQEEVDIILQARHSVLIHQEHPWTKKGEEPFDVTMGAYDGAEICELVGLYILSLLAALPYGKAAQYRDDGLMVLRGSSRQVEVKKKQIATILKSTGIGITITANLKVVNFLDLTLDLETGTYKTYNKPNNTPQYVHKQSSHPPNVTKNIPLNVNQRLSGNSSNEKLFEETAPIFQQALKNSGYEHKLRFKQANPGEKK